MIHPVGWAGAQPNRSFHHCCPSSLTFPPSMYDFAWSMSDCSSVWLVLPPMTMSWSLYRKPMAMNVVKTMITT